jgi:hypothetical protein
MYIHEGLTDGSKRFVGYFVHAKPKKYRVRIYHPGIRSREEALDEVVCWIHDEWHKFQRDVSPSPDPVPCPKGKANGRPKGRAKAKAKVQASPKSLARSRGRGKGRGK